MQSICTLFWYTFWAQPYIIYHDSDTEIEVLTIWRYNKKGWSGDNKKEDREGGGKTLLGKKKILLIIKILTNSK